MYQVMLGYTGKCLDVLGYARMCKDVLGSKDTDDVGDVGLKHFHF